MLFSVNHPNHETGHRNLMPLSTEEETEAQSRKVRCDHKSQGRNYLQVFCPRSKALPKVLPSLAAENPPSGKFMLLLKGLRTIAAVTAVPVKPD